MWARDGKRREMGLGAYPVVTLAKARAKATECRSAVEEGRDPIAEKAKEAEPTFGDCADKYIATIKSEWRTSANISGIRRSPVSARASGRSGFRQSQPKTF
ncbi:Arm DNA-binding domain-containing protein [Mesorhizobium sp. M0106]|uniref:Arm DNA-binding domain-containing protein n=1 Tax=Mesorhizobium sp. M0106 TaxID=2956880 RepID=UPI003338D43E